MPFYPAERDEKNCPLCGAEVDICYQSSARAPFTAPTPLEGLVIWGPYSSEKRIVCQDQEWVHFVFADGEARLVRLAAP